MKWVWVLLTKKLLILLHLRRDITEGRRLLTQST